LGLTGLHFYIGQRKFFYYEGDTFKQSLEGGKRVHYVMIWEDDIQAEVRAREKQPGW
jgi:hypothetical protein